MAAASSHSLALRGSAHCAQPRRRPVTAYRSRVRASHSASDKNEKVYKELGLFSLKKKIEDAVARAEKVITAEMEVEEARRIRQEKVFHEFNLWNDLVKSNESLAALADAIKVVNDLKDLRCKAEEAKLITQLVDMDVINHQLFKQAYKASLDISKFLDQYEISKLLSGPYDKEGACLIIRAGPDEGIASKIWAEKLLCMYTNWGEKYCYKMRSLVKYPRKDGGLSLATLEFESENVYGYLSGEKGIHRKIRSSLDGSVIRQTCSAGVDVIPLFLEGPPNLHIDDKDLEISSTANVLEQPDYRKEAAVSIQHIPSSITVQCSGERSQFANKIKALDRLKAKLLVVGIEQDMPEVNRMKMNEIVDESKKEIRRYMFRPKKSVEDMKTGIQLHDLNSVLNGNIEPLVKAHVSLRHGREMV